MVDDQVEELKNSQPFQGVNSETVEADSDCLFHRTEHLNAQDSVSRLSTNSTVGGLIIGLIDFHGIRLFRRNVTHDPFTEGQNCQTRIDA